jgi:hypothetical protein
MKSCIAWIVVYATIFSTVTVRGVSAFQNFAMSRQQLAVAATTPLYYYASSEERLPARRRILADEQRKEWIDRSLSYYNKVMREERRRNLGQAKHHETADYQEDFMVLAKKHYFALRKIKDGKPEHAEKLYRRIIDELSSPSVDNDQHCDHAKLAVTTLLLALLLQRLGDVKQTRSVFLNFFRIAVLDNKDGEECACSAKVLQAYALFEMKQGHAMKSLDIVRKAVQLDGSLAPILKWKQFRDALERRSTTLAPYISIGN